MGLPVVRKFLQLLVSVKQAPGEEEELPTNACIIMHSLEALTGCHGSSVPNMVFGEATSNTFLFTCHHNSASLPTVTGWLELEAGVESSKPPTFSIKLSSLCMSTLLKLLAHGFRFPSLFLATLNSSRYCSLLSASCTCGCGWERTKLHGDTHSTQWTRQARHLTPWTQQTQ